MSEFVDLDAQRAARAELAEQRGIRLGGEDFVLVSELPLDTISIARSGDFERALGGLLADESDLDRLMSVRPTIADFESILAVVFGVDPGEATASSPRSKSTGRRSRPTSGGSTASTSAKRAGAKKKAAAKRK